MPRTFHAAAVRNLAEEHGDTTLELISKRTGLTKGHLSWILRGLREPKTNTVARIADAYGTDIDSILRRDAA